MSIGNFFCEYKRGIFQSLDDNKRKKSSSQE